MSSGKSIQERAQALDMYTSYFERFLEQANGRDNGKKTTITALNGFTVTIEPMPLWEKFKALFRKGEGRVFEKVTVTDKYGRFFKPLEFNLSKLWKGNRTKELEHILAEELSNAKKIKEKAVNTIENQTKQLDTQIKTVFKTQETQPKSLKQLVFRPAVTLPLCDQVCLAIDKFDTNGCQTALQQYENLIDSLHKAEKYKLETDVLSNYASRLDEAKNNAKMTGEMLEHELGKFITMVYDAAFDDKDSNKKQEIKLRLNFDQIEKLRTIRDSLEKVYSKLIDLRSPNMNTYNHLKENLDQVIRAAVLKSHIEGNLTGRTDFTRFHHK